jgi:Ca2+/H+ antiporter
MKPSAQTPVWTIAAPIFAGAVLLAAGFGSGFGGIVVGLITIGLAGSVFAAVMIILNGIIGLCLLVGGIMHREQSFSLDGVSAALVALGTLVLRTGRTIILHGVVLLTVFVVYLFATIVP